MELDGMKSQLEDSVVKLEGRIAEITDDPGKFIQEKLSSIDYHLSRIPCKHSTEPRTISMYDHLVRLRKKIEDDSISVVTKEVNALKSQKQKLEAELSSMQELDSESKDESR